MTAKFQFANLTFKQQADFFAKKINLPTDTYLDLQGQEHDYFFAVAGANKVEVLGELRRAIDDAIYDGQTIDDFRKRFDKIVEKTGWQYKGGRNWRTRIIFDTNIYGAYNRGRLEQHLDLAEALPYWEYIHNDSSHPRPQHQAWHGLVLRYDDPWWKYHYPIKAYGCHCTVLAHDDSDLKRLGKKISTAPKIETLTKTIGGRSGNPMQVEIVKGNDYGFAITDFNHLTATRNANIDKVLMQKMITAAPKFASRAVSYLLDSPEAKIFHNAFADFVEQTMQTTRTQDIVKLVGVIPLQAIQRLEEIGQPIQSAVIAINDKQLWHAMRDTKVKPLPIEVWKKLPEILRKGQIYLDKNTESTLLYVLDMPQGKIAVRQNYKKKLKLEGKKKTYTLNQVITGQILNDKEYKEIKNSWERLY